ncbi:MAG: thioesterase family protein [Gammaproteobacteria bacterium]|nr:thioesterase family protein [Gammaproteobacteria bacterium]
MPAETKRGPFISYQIDFDRMSGDGPLPPRKSLWIKANGQAPAGERLHSALLAYESDSALLGTARMPHRGSFKQGELQMASLDHAMWFHEPVNVNDWLLYTMESPASASGRGYNRGMIYTQDGRLVASCIQEGLMRLWD